MLAKPIEHSTSFCPITICNNVVKYIYDSLIFEGLIELIYEDSIKLENMIP